MAPPDNVPWWYLGPLGRLYALPIVTPGLEAPLEKIAARHRSLNARTTEDVRGFRRSWSLEFRYLDADDMAYLEAAFSGIVRPPLRLVDPLRRNRLSLAASAPALWPEFNHGTTAAQATSGAVTTVYDVPWPSVDRAPLDGRARGFTADTVLRWRMVTLPGAVTLDAPPYVPVLPGETVTASVYVRSTAPSVTLDIVPRTAEGDATATVSTASGVDTWQRLTVTHTATESQLAVYPRVSGSGTTGDVYLAAAQVETGDTATAWAPGSGCPEVLITELPQRSPVYPLTTAGLTLVEV